MTSNGVAFDTYEVIAPSNVYLNDDNIVQAIGMGSIVNDVLVKGKIKRICIKYVLHMPKLKANLLLVSKVLSNILKVRFNLNECIVRHTDDEVVAIVLDRNSSPF